ncbi:hypothetical protein [Romboutsia lituseburensis]|nr:hypothetical protein [Romboutsia lituseburensis]MCR8747136.1 hypothetical protein [Romboutsia lituseburensis]
MSLLGLLVLLLSAMASIFLIYDCIKRCIWFVEYLKSLSDK